MASCQACKGEGLVQVRNERVTALTLEIQKCLNVFYAKTEFKQAELVLAFNEIMMVQRDVDRYHETMR